MYQAQGPEYKGMQSQNRSRQQRAEGLMLAKLLMAAKEASLFLCQTLAMAGNGHQAIPVPSTIVYCFVGCLFDGW